MLGSSPNQAAGLAPVWRTRVQTDIQAARGGRQRRRGRSPWVGGARYRLGIRSSHPWRDWPLERIRRTDPSAIVVRPSRPGNKARRLAREREDSLRFQLRVIRKRLGVV